MAAIATGDVDAGAHVDADDRNPVQVAAAPFLFIFVTISLLSVSRFLLCFSLFNKFRRSSIRILKKSVYKQEFKTKFNTSFKVFLQFLFFFSLSLRFPVFDIVCLN